MEINEFPPWLVDLNTHDFLEVTELEIVDHWCEND